MEKSDSPGLLEAFLRYPQVLYWALNRLVHLASVCVFGTTSLVESPAVLFEKQ